MSIRPVDMQVVVQKTQEIHHAKQTVVNKMDNELAHAQTRTKEEHIKRHQMVNQLERSETRKVKNEREEEDQRHSKQNQKRQSKEIEEHEDELNKKVRVSGTHFDMKV
ncbi:MAG TPA: hypothetical protein DCS67_08085 [Clostridiales bacterium UBA8960]|jgi:site-specific DNA-cytosine methylase|nr:hypothetical protein [Clostridiales bacterium UBA8960]